MIYSGTDKNTKGQALIVVITFLSLLFIVGLVFFVLSQNERTAASRNLDSLRVRYITEAGVAYARQLLKLDKEANLIDSLEDMTFTNASGTDVDLDGNGTPESRWFALADKDGASFGRFGVKVLDEASKINVNAASQETLEQLLSRFGVDTSKAGSLVSRRPFNAIEQIGPILGKKDFLSLRDFVTIYSRDREINLDRERRQYLNSCNWQAILDAFLNTGVNNPFQKAVNLKDASDPDLAQTFFDEYIRSYVFPTRLLENGDWNKTGNYYEAPAGGEAGKFSWTNLSIEDGEYTAFFYGPTEQDVIGEVSLEGEEGPGELLFSGDALRAKVNVSGSAFTVNIKPAAGTNSRFSYVELISLEPKNGLMRKVITGTEALVINELMVKPSQQILLDDPIELMPGEMYTGTLSSARTGSYYAKVLANVAGGRVGDVKINGVQGTGLYDGDYLPSAVNISSGSIAIEVKNNTLSKVTFKGIKLLQQPDGEFIEILNLSPDELDLSNVSVEVYSLQNELAQGWPAKIPEGVKIKPYQHMVLAADSNDGAPTPAKIRSNNISFQKIWGSSGTGLEFAEVSDG